MNYRPPDFLVCIRPSPRHSSQGWVGLPFFLTAEEMSHEIERILQLFTTPMDCSPPGSFVHGISQARILEWVAIPFSRRWTVALQAPLSMGFPRQEYWSGLPFPSPGDLPDPGIEPKSPALQANSLPSEPPRRPPETSPTRDIKRIPRRTQFTVSPWLSSGGRFQCRAREFDS